MSLVASTLEFIRKHRLFGKGDRLLVGLSGGADSVALLTILSELRKKIGFQMSAVYVNHSIRPRATKAEARFCDKLCRDLDIQFESLVVDVPTEAVRNRTSLETAARDARRRVLRECAERLGANKIALGHHADDQVETILFRVLRGTGPTGIIGMKPGDGTIVRPLLIFQKPELTRFLLDRKQEWCEDRSNRQLKFTRNRIRHSLLPKLRKEFNPQVDRALLDMAELIDEEHAVVAARIKAVAARVLTTSPGGKLILDLHGLAAYDNWLRRGLLRHCLMVSCDSELGPDRSVVDRALNLIKRNSGRMSMPRGVQAEISDNRLYLYTRTRRKIRANLVTPGSTSLSWPRVDLSTRVIRSISVETMRRSKPSVAYIDFEKTKPPFVVRVVRSGDRFRPLGMRGRKKVGDFLTDRKYPRALRDEVLVVSDRGGIVWLVGQEIDDRYKVEPGTRKVLRIECHVRKEE